MDLRFVFRLYGGTFYGGTFYGGKFYGGKFSDGELFLIMRKRKLASLLCAVVSLVLLSAVHARADGAADNATDWYFDAGLSLYVVDVPKYAPLWDNDAPGVPSGPYTNPKRITLMDGPIAAPLFEASVGKELADQWFVETRFEYAIIGSDHLTHNKGTGTAYTHGTTFCPLDGTSTDLRGSWEYAEAALEFEFQQYGAALLAGKTYGGDDWQIRPFAGYWHLERDTTYNMDFDDGFNLPTFFSDKLETTYDGLLVGVGLTLPMNGWDIELETTHGMGFGLTRYSGGWDTSGAKSSYLTLHKGKRTYRGTLQVSASFSSEVDWDLKFTCALRYLSYVPRLMSSGQATNANFAGPAHLVGESSFSGKLGLEISHSF